MLYVEKTTSRYRKIIVNSLDQIIFDGLSWDQLSYLFPDGSIEDDFDKFDIPVHNSLDLLYDSQEDTVVEFSGVEFIYDAEIYRTNRILKFSEMSFNKRIEILPDYKLVNSGLDIYDATETANIKATVEAFRTEFYRIKTIIDGAEDQETIEAIVENYPTEIIEV